MNKIKNIKRKLSAPESAELLSALETRFKKNMNRHKGVEWATVEAKLKAHLEKLWSLNEMEKTGGEPDVISLDKKSGEYTFCDCSAESPRGRRSVCYDHEALEGRKENKPENSAVQMAENMGIELLTEEQYRALQKLGAFDTKTSSWIKLLPKFENLVVLYFAISVMAMCLFIITVLNRTMGCEASGFF